MPQQADVIEPPAWAVDETALDGLDSLETPDSDVSQAVRDALALKLAVDNIFTRSPPRPAYGSLDDEPIWSLQSKFEANPEPLTDRDLTRLIRSDWTLVQDVPEARRTSDLCKLAALRNWGALEHLPSNIDRTDFIAAVITQNPARATHLPVCEVTYEVLHKVPAQAQRVLLRRRPFLVTLAGTSQIDLPHILEFSRNRHFTSDYLLTLARLIDHPSELHAIKPSFWDGPLLDDLLRCLPKAFFHLPEECRTWIRFEPYIGTWALRNLHMIENQQFWLDLAESPKVKSEYLAAMPRGVGWLREVHAQWISKNPEWLEFLPHNMDNLLHAAQHVPHALVKYAQRAITKHMDQLTPVLNDAIADGYVQALPTNFLKLPVSHQTWKRVEPHFGTWILDHLKDIKSHDFWVGLAHSERWRRAFLYLAPRDVEWGAELPLAWIRQQPELIEVLPQNPDIVWLAIETNPRAIKHVRAPAPDLIKFAVEQDSRCAKNIRQSRLAPEIIDMAVRSRLQHMKRVGQVVDEEALQKTYRDDLVQAHAASYALWALDNNVFKGMTFGVAV